MKVLPDTNVVITFFRDLSKRDEFESRIHRPPFFMSSVVALELFAGCRTPCQAKAMTNFLKPFEKVDRVRTTPPFEKPGGCWPDWAGMESEQRIAYRSSMMSWSP
ncbi:MAG TPA: hypothetical protein VH325_08030 [Bryobacteraceae bacterium]|nr:hypothetical protein [Bryobacteraceae bacterium]